MSPCGLPGCGHSPGSYGADHVSGHLKTGAGCVECSCPGYRTLEQQEAHDDLSFECDKWRRASDGPRSVPNVVVKAERLLELYP
jgi:hypothetical protein